MKIISFDFDYWMKLQKENPKRFKQERVEFIKQNINAASSDPVKRWNMRKMQLEIDKEIRKQPLLIERSNTLLTMSILSSEKSIKEFNKLLKIFK